MRKISKMAVILFITAALTGCLSTHAENSATHMDFQEQVEWKTPAPAASARPRILFVGNSHTFYNNLSRVFVNIADATGHKSDVYEISQGYYSLKQFSDPNDKAGSMLNQILTGKEWDFVILQENTSIALSSSAEEDMFPYARTLDEKVKAAGGQTAFLMTWAPKNGIKTGLKQHTVTEAQSMLAGNYISISQKLDDLLIPAGVGFMRCMDAYPEIELWDADGQHPSPAGTYLTACTIYSVIFQESPENCSYTGDLEPELASKLQKIAADMILQ